MANSFGLESSVRVCSGSKFLSLSTIEMVSAEDPTTFHGSYVAAYSWSERLREPPRLTIPPPSLDFSHGQPSMIVKHPTSMDYDSNQFGNPAFLQALITNGSVTLAHKMLDWRYDNRREAQTVLPFLYIGPLSAAKNEKFIRETGFTFMVSVRSTASGPTRTMNAAKMAAQYGISSYNVDIDSPTDLMRKFPAAIKTINDHLEYTASGSSLNVPESVRPVSLQGKVLIFCETGNERSAAFVAAYLMAVFNIDVITAIQTVQSQRFSICIDDSTKNALGTFEMLLKAERDVGRANRFSNEDYRKDEVRLQNHLASAGLARSKRTLDNVYNDDETMELHNWCSNQQGEARRGSAPFHDMEA